MVSTRPSTKDYRILLYGLLSCMHYGWDILAGRKFHRIPFLFSRAICHLAFFWLFEQDSRLRAIKIVRVGTALFLLVGAWQKLQELPIIWDSDSWTIQTDTTVGIWLLVQCFFGSGDSSSMIVSGRNDETVDDVLFSTIRDMLANFYFAAAFWKVNSHFLDPDASCATMFLVQIVVYYLRPVIARSPWVASPDTTLISVASAVKQWAPLSAVVGELLFGGLMMLGSIVSSPTGQVLQSLGSMLSLSFHLMVCLLPAPNDISGFALACAPRQIVFATATGTSRAMERFYKHKSLSLTAFVVGVGIGIQNQWTENNWAFLLYFFAGGFVALSVGSDMTHTAGNGERNESHASRPSDEMTNRRPFGFWVAVGFAFLYSFVLPMLGLQEETTANMFANLKAGHGGSNHYLLPTGLFFHWFDEAPDSHPFGGGVIRIENTTSDWFRTIYPADLTSMLKPNGFVEVMDAIGNPPPIYFNPGANRNLRHLTEVPDKFFRYTVPALEFKRLLHEALEKDKNFVLTYSKLPGTRGDEVWRATATDTVTTIEARKGKITECRKISATSQWIPCQSDDLPYISFLESVPWIIRRLSMYHAYPIVVGPDHDVSEIPRSIRCFGP